MLGTPVGGAATASAAASKAGQVLTPRDVFDDLRTPAAAATARTGAGDGAIAAVAAAGGMLAFGGGDSQPATPMTARSERGDVFDFLVTPRTQVAAVGAAGAVAGTCAPPQVCGAAAGGKPI